MNQPQNETCYFKSDHVSIPNMRRFSHEAMATTFEVIIVHEDGRYAQQAARAAFDEVDRLETELSRFIENSDISRINNLPANQPVVIGLAAFECLQLSAGMYDETNGAFDVTFRSGYSILDTRCLMQESKIKNPIKLDATQHTVELLTSQIQIDLGGIGKGYSVDRVAKLLREWSIDTALISGGYSSVLALDAPDNTKGWPVTVSHPDNHKQILARLCLEGRSLGASGVQQGRHIIDPRTARPVGGKLAAWACAGDAATADALSTSFMVMSPDEIEQYCLRHPEVQALVILQEEEKKPSASLRGGPQREKILRYGQWKKHELLK